MGTAADAAPRVASGGLCADQFVLELADPAQIVGISPQATNPLLSIKARQAGAYPVLRNDAESLIASGADVVVVPGWRARKSGPLLRAAGLSLVELPLDETFDQIAVTVQRVADALGQSARGNALVTRMRRQIAAARPTGNSGNRPRAVYFRPDGGGAGSGTFVNTVMEAAGLRNLAAEIGIKGWGRMGLEQLVMSAPDMLVISFFDNRPPGLRAMFSRHPLFERLMADKPVIAVPGKYWICGGWFLADAVTVIAVERPR